MSAKCCEFNRSLANYYHLPEDILTNSGNTPDQLQIGFPLKFILMLPSLAEFGFSC